jgi:hypothetical protein
VSVTLADQFVPGGEATTVYVPVLFCNPALKIHYTQTTPAVGSSGNPFAFPTITLVDHPGSHLTCYLTVLAPGQSPVTPPPVLYNNQFVIPGTVSTLSLAGSDLLCVPSFKLSWNVIAAPGP